MAAVLFVGLEAARGERRAELGGGFLQERSLLSGAVGRRERAVGHECALPILKILLQRHDLLGRGGREFEPGDETADLPGLQGDIATETGLDSKQKTMLTVELKARADALKK